jgi:hypothetical protein
MQRRLHASAERSTTRARATHADAHRRLRQALAADARRPGGGALREAARALSAEQVFRVYETGPLARAEEDAAAAPAEAGMLAAQLREARGANGAAPVLVAARKVAAAEAARRAEERAAALAAELEARPGAAEHTRLLRQVDILVRRLGRLQGVVPLGAAGARGRPARPATPNDRAEDVLPQAVLAELVRDAGAALGCGGEEAAARVARAAARVPRLEEWADAVCTAVFCRGGGAAAEDAAAVPAELARWARQPGELGAARAALRAVGESLGAPRGADLD